MRRLWWCLALFAIGCTDVDRPPESVSLADEVIYSDHVQPYVGLACGSLDCHGDTGRPLRLFAEYGLRARGELRDTPITEAEVHANVLAFAGVSPTTSSELEHLAVLKPLAPEAGGMGHEGNDVWPDKNHPGYLCVVSWLSQGNEAVAASQCADAYAPIAPDEP